MAINPRPVEPGSSPGSVEEIDFSQGGAQPAEADEVPSVPARPEPIGGAGEESDRPDLDNRSPEPRRGRFRAVYMGFFAVLAIVAVVWLAYQWGLEAGYREEVPIIKAEQTPLKVKPDNPGGLVVPDQDKTVLNQGAQGEDAPRVERLLSAPEMPQPLPKPEPPSSAQAAAEPSPAPDSDSAASQQAALPESQEPAPKPEPIEAPAEPSETAAAPSAVVAQQEAEAPEVPAAPESPAVASESTPAPKPAETAAAESGGQSGGEAAGTQAPEPSTPSVPLQELTGGGGGAKPAATQLAAITKGDYVIQLAAVGSGEAAQKEWSRLQKSFPALLGDMPLSVQEVTVKGKLYHRVQTGPFPSRATARDMCAQLKSRNQACIVQRR